jgi:hypothetical protein
MNLSNLIESYIAAKDGNRPHILGEAFEASAQLEMEIKTDKISFPTSVQGIDGIAKVLVSEFAQKYENVYTYCLGEPPQAGVSFCCYWLVCMTEKGSGAARIGYGRYQWDRRQEGGKLCKLRITIEEMHSLPAEWSPQILGWARALPYPWCPFDALARTAPALVPVQNVVSALTRGGAAST